MRATAAARTQGAREAPRGRGGGPARGVRQAGEWPGTESGWGARRGWGRKRVAGLPRFRSKRAPPAHTCPQLRGNDHRPVCREVVPPISAGLFVLTDRPPGSHFHLR